MPDGLLEAAKNYLDITWTDPAGDTKLSGILTRGIAYLNDKTKHEWDYSLEGKPRELLFEYARYVRADKLSQFLKDYLHELSELQITARMVSDV